VELIAGDYPEGALSGRAVVELEAERAA